MWMIDMEALYITLATLLVLFLLYLLVLVLPRAKQPKMQTILCNYAHRGLHNTKIPENSLKAFENACLAGYGIELDVQLTKDGVVVVFHDGMLTRMCGIDKRVCNCTYEELSALRLLSSDEKIPTFSEVLSLVNGRVPLLVELKGESTNTSLCSPVAELLRAYDGPYCIESFNPILLGAMRKELPDAYFGLLYTNACREKKKFTAVNVLVTLMALNVVAKPNFIAYNKNLRKNPLVFFTTKICHCPRFVWTVKGREEYEEALSRGEYPIFENLE